MIETKLNLNSPELLELKERLKADSRGIINLRTLGRITPVQAEYALRGLSVAIDEIESLDRPYNAGWN
ncbi:hypothetical protein [Loigolactobacillus bifermentans]|uniref:Uncharacterized protein n=1 Tax=Loigolactobacillus bifermentans DSM 20003 TaxID=1423726 RepID=A0A0R1GJZ0_9LACO|nr:hypothetical protein [Loigolactobacillus bifermentans]KRK34396.1 hypothetical protein FC07_GL000605 [Loigolactobacillus bifermentans DSM 20003]QGG60104.1 hypothetical protein LB003_06365 [Loigolactobacillus bifermentans]